MNTTEHRYEDEVSLRDLYLIFKRGLPLIVIVALLGAVAGFVVRTINPPEYISETTVVINTTPARSGSAELIGRTNLSFPTYQSLAWSQAVMQETAVTLGLSGEELVRLPDRLTLERVDENGGVQTVVIHEASADTAEGAAALANTWAEATMQAATDSMLAALEPIAQTNEAELETFGSNLAALEAAWRDLQDRDDTAILTAELNSLVSRKAAAGEQLDSTARDLAANLARQEVLRGALEAARSAGGDVLESDADTLMNLLASQGLLNERISAELANFLSTPGTDSQVVALVLGLQLQSTVTSQASTEASRDLLMEQIQTYDAEAAARRASIATLAQERVELQRDLTAAETLYLNAMQLKPAIDYVGQVIPSNLRALDTAQPPLEPEGRGRALAAVIGLVVGGLLATVFVFLRAAIAPEPA